jgi:putative acetyltransferase
MTVAVEVRGRVPADDEAISRVVVAAFLDEGPLIVDLIHALRAHSCGRDGLDFVAVVDGEVVGHVLVTRGRLDTFERVIDVAVLAPLAVDPRLHRQGIGRRLVERAIADAAERFPVIFLEGDPAFYSRLGFLPGKPLGFRKPSIRIPDGAFQAVILPSFEPWMTGTLVYAEPFWDLDCVGLRDPQFIAWLRDEVAAGREW